MSSDDGEDDDFPRTVFDPELFKGLTGGERIELTCKLSAEAYYAHLKKQGKIIPPRLPRNQLPVRKFMIKDK